MKPSKAKRTTVTDINIGNRLKYLREKRAVNLEDEASNFGLSKGQWHKYEQAINRISASRLHEYCNFHNEDITTFFRAS